MRDRHGTPEDGDGDWLVERILAGGLPVNPPANEHIERLRESVREEWQTTLTNDPPRLRSGLRTWHRGVAAAAALAALAVALSSWVATTSQHEAIGLLARVIDGDVEIGRGLLRHRALKAGEALPVGETVVAHGSTLVSLARGGTLRIGAGTTVRITAMSQVELERGLLYVDMPHEGPSSNPLRVVTSAGVVEHIGTEYEVMASGDAVRIRVREGKIRFSNARTQLLADAGTELTASPGGPISTQSVATFGRDWQWVAALAPDYAIEDKSLSEVLGSLARELGRPLAYADARAREIADATILHGSLHGEPPFEALVNVLGTTSLTYKINADTICVYSVAPRTATSGAGGP